jgi:hypothetical protein
MTPLKQARSINFSSAQMLSFDDNTNLYNIVAINAEAEFMNVQFL